MSLRRRLWLTMAVLVLLGFLFSLRYFINDLRPQHAATMEESLVDQAHLLAHIAAEEWNAPNATLRMERLFTPASDLAQPAPIYSINKDEYHLSVTVTNQDGLVIVGPESGADHSQWNNIIRTMRGEYGARASRLDPDDPHSTILHVSAPIIVDQKIVGVLTVSKSEQSIEPFLISARWSIIIALAYVGIGMVCLAALLTIWTTWPLRKLLNYVKNYDGKTTQQLPKIGPSDLRILGEAFVEMSARLEGKAYIERYVSALSHELKSPIAAIRGAAELLTEDLPPADRIHFTTNILRDSKRCELLCDQLVHLAALERLGQLPNPQTCDLAAICRQELTLHEPASFSSNIDEPLPCRGNPELLQLALANIISNAKHFSPQEGRIQVSGHENDDQIGITISDNGPGIPEWALAKVKDRFFSLPRPNGQKSSGLGLSLVAEICDLHNGQFNIRSQAGKGTSVTLILPKLS